MAEKPKVYVQQKKKKQVNGQAGGGYAQQIRLSHKSASFSLGSFLCSHVSNIFPLKIRAYVPAF